MTVIVVTLLHARLGVAPVTADQVLAVASLPDAALTESAAPLTVAVPAESAARMDCAAWYVAPMVLAVRAGSAARPAARPGTVAHRGIVAPAKRLVRFRSQQGDHADLFYMQSLHENDYIGLNCPALI